MVDKVTFGLGLGDWIGVCPRDRACIYIQWVVIHTVLFNFQTSRVDSAHISLMWLRRPREGKRFPQVMKVLSFESKAQAFSLHNYVSVCRGPKLPPVCSGPGGECFSHE